MVHGLLINKEPTLLGQPSLATLRSLARKIARLDADWSSRGDRRGLFTALYGPCIERVQAEILRGAFRNSSAVELIARRLAARFLEGGLHWRRFERLAADRSVSDARVLGTALNAHLTIDLARALVGAPTSFESDLLWLGRLVVDEVGSVAARPQHASAQRATLVLSGGGLEKVVRTIAGEDGGFPALLSQSWEASRRGVTRHATLRLVFDRRDALLSKH